MIRLLAILTFLSIGFGASCTAQPSAAYLAKRDAFVVGLILRKPLVTIIVGVLVFFGSQFLLT